MHDLLDTITQYWGYDTFLPLQEEATRAVLAGRDSLVVLPTGGGKSLCFQAPAAALPGMAVVVSPLISLMKDQVDSLRECGVPAACLNSAITPQELWSAERAAEAGELKLLYLAPERLMQPLFLEWLGGLEISFVAIDEAHCISMWGHDFRPEYRDLNRLRKLLPGRAVHAYTATATAQVREDIAKQLHLADPEVLVGSFDRPNLHYRVERRASGSRRLTQLREVIDVHAGESGIIYTISRKNVESLTAELKAAGYRAAPYHAGLNDVVRARNQEAFIREEVEIIVATIAFGMGIDKSNVRYVLHAGMPKSLENYQQESGRAGRDGLAADCCLFYSLQDYAVWQRITGDADAETAEMARRKLQEMLRFCAGATCRHGAILRYFGQEPEGSECGACDVCKGDVEFIADPLVVAQKILSCVFRLNQSFGTDYTAKVLGGSKEARIRENLHDQLSTYGILEKQGNRNIRTWIDQLISQGFLVIHGEYSVLRITDAGWRLLKGEAQPRLTVPAAPEPAAPARSPRDREGVDEGLFECLRTLRRELARERAVPPFVVFNDPSLLDMARIRPTTTEGFMAVRGVGETKCEAYGPTFTAVIGEYCREHGVESDLLPASFSPPSSVPAPRKKRPQKKDKRNEARELAVQLFRRGRSVDEVARLVNRKPSTCQGYLNDFIAQEGITDCSPWVDPEEEERILEAVAASDTERHAAIHDALGGTIHWDSIRIAIACRRNRVVDPATEALEAEG